MFATSFSECVLLRRWWLPARAAFRLYQWTRLSSLLYLGEWFAGRAVRAQRLEF